MLRGRLLASLALLLVPAGPCFASATAVAIEQRLAVLPPGARAAVGSGTVRGSDLMTEFYRRRSYEPAWVGGSGDPGVDELAETLGRSAEQGLDPNDYHLGGLAELRREGKDSADAAAGLDLLLTDALVRLAFDVRYGRVQAAQIDPLSLRSHPLVSADPVADLEQAVGARRVQELLEALEPATPYYGALKKLLAGQRAIAAAGGWPMVPPGPSLKPGMRQERVPVLRERLAVTGDLRAEPREAADLYDDATVEGVKAFQDRHGLDADGAVGAQTLAALQVPVEARIDQVRANLERARWLLRDLPPRYVMVNTAGYRALLAEDGKALWRSRVIVGKPDTATPMFRAAIRSVILNPTWTVPPSIVRGEFPARSPAIPATCAASTSRCERPPRAGPRSRQRTRPSQAEHAQPVLGVHARHADALAVRPRGPRVQPRLRARAGPRRPGGARAGRSALDRRQPRGGHAADGRTRELLVKNRCR